jgi:hypothetical protein
METAAPTQTVFVTAHIDLTGNRGGLLGGRGVARVASGELRSPHPSLVLWRVIERVSVEKQLLEREIQPAEDGQSVFYRYAVSGGGGGLFPIDEAGHFEAELVAAFAPPSFLTEVGQVEIISTSVPQDVPKGSAANVRRGKTFSSAQLEGRLIRLPDDADSTIWFVEQGVKRPLESPTCGRMRFGEGWRRLIQPLTSAQDAVHVPDGPLLTLAEASEGRLVYSWPKPETYLVQGQYKRRIDDPAPIAERFGDHWRVKLIHLAPQELALIPDGASVSA